MELHKLILKTPPNKPLTATKPTAMLQAKVAPLLRLAAGRWGQYIINSSHTRNGKEK